jgi:hypothetical protein
MNGSEDEIPNSDIPETYDAPNPTPAYDWRHWARRLLVCNPFFLCSAALLLYGINRLSIDPNFLSDETQNLLFNFSALHLYEVLVVCTAILLCRRKAWYDSALLVVLENGLLLVPFILITQANLISRQFAWILTLVGAFAVAGRLIAVRRWYSEFNLPNRALLLGVVVLAANVVLPRIFRNIVELDYEGWRTPNVIIWYGFLPLLAIGANVLPRPKRYGVLNPERSWLPLFIYGLWIVGTAVHAWCAAYICKIPFQIEWLGPVAWVTGWTIFNRLTDCVAAPSISLRRTILATTFAIPLLALMQPAQFVVIAGLNGLVYLALWKVGPESLRRTVGELALGCVPLMFAAVPLDWSAGWLPKLSREEHVLCAVVIYLILLALRSRRPEIGMLGALAVAIGMGWLARSWTFHAAVQASLVFLLIHSLHWPKADYPNAHAFRWIAAVGWVLDAVVWTREPTFGECIFVAAGALVALSAWVFVRRQSGKREFLIPASAFLVLSSGPGNWFYENSPAGLLAVAGSLLLFLAGAVLAWTRPAWNPRAEAHSQE